MGNMRRHGDIVIQPIPKAEAKKLRMPESKERVLAYGEVTGHAHRMDRHGTVAVLDRPADKGGKISVLSVDGQANLSHEEHKTLALPEGMYAFAQKRQYSDSDRGWDTVID